MSLTLKHWAERLQINLDDTSLSILRYIILHGPCTVYRIAKEEGLYFSYAYRKARKLEVSGAIKQVKGNGKVSYYVPTPLGQIVCLSYDCLEEDFILHRLAREWGITEFMTADEVRAFIDLYMRMYRQGAPLERIELMGLYILTHFDCILEAPECLNEITDSVEEMVAAMKVVGYSIISILKKMYRAGGEMALANGDGYLAAVALNAGEPKVLAAECRLCGYTKYCSVYHCEKLTERIRTDLFSSMRMKIK